MENDLIFWFGFHRELSNWLSIMAVKLFSLFLSFFLQFIFGLFQFLYFKFLKKILSKKLQFIY